MEKLFLCPLCNKRKAWVSSTYPSVVVHNCQGTLEEVGRLYSEIEELKTGQVVKHFRFEPIKHCLQTKESFIIKPISNVDELKHCFQSLHLDECAYFTSQALYRNFPYWENLWDFSCFKVISSKTNQVAYLLLFDSDRNFRKHASCCMGFKGHKPSLEEAKNIITSCKKVKNLQVRDEALALHYITKELER